MTPPFLPPETPRLRFRLWREDDLPLAMGLWGDPRVTALIDARGALDEGAVRRKLDEEIARAAEHGVQYWPVFLREGEHVGCAGLRVRDATRRVFELGFHVRAAFWGRGLAREAANACIAFAFGELGASALFAGHHPDNEASRALLAKLGFVWTHDEAYAATGRMHPSYELLREDEETRS